MKSLQLPCYGKANQLSYTDIPKPTLKPDEILVKVYAVGLNPIDYMITKGAFKPIIKLQLPATIGSDLAGVVMEIGNDVTRFKLGDAVFASTFDLGTGTLAEYAAVPERVAALKPNSLDFIQAASIPMVGLTSWQALKERAGIKAGQKVFIPAGSGGIGTFAIQLAKHFGAKVGTTTSTKNIAMVTKLGADEVVDYKQQAFEHVLTDYDVVLGTIKGNVIEKSLQILKPNSHIVSLIGPPDAAFAKRRGMPFLMQLLFGLLSYRIIQRAKKVGAEYSFLFVQSNGAQLAEIGKLLEAEKIVPMIDKIYPFEKTKEALEYLETGRAAGKVVVKIAE